MKHAKDLLLLLLKLKSTCAVRHSLERCMPYLRSILRLAVSWMHKLTSRTSRRTKRVDSPQLTLDLALPSILPISSYPPQPDHSAAVPQQSFVLPTPTISRSSSQDDNSPQPATYFAKNIVAVTTSEFERYQRDYKLPQVFTKSFIIKRFTTDFSAPGLPSNWTAYTHPEGALYFHDKSRKILTDVYIYDKTALDDLEVIISKIRNHPSIQRIWPADDTSIELVLELRQTERYGYYFVDHTHRCLFWPEDFDFIDFISEVKVNYTTSHVGKETISHYWFHNEMFPHILDVPEDAIEELIDTIIHAIGDSLTSKTSTAPYDMDHLHKMLNIVKDVQVHRRHGAGAACIIYRFLRLFAHERFLNLYGERGARLNKNQSIHPDRPRTLLLTIFSPLLLYGPETHYNQLKEMSVDSLVNEPSWVHILKKLTDEWKEFTLYATVVLTANVAFLAIQSIDEAAPPGGRTGIQRASYFSIITSIGAIILGLSLVRQHHVVLKMDFLANRSVTSLGLETLALMYSLPYGLLMWSMMSFLLAFSLLCFESGDLITVILIGICWFILGLFLLWCISSSFETSPYYYPWLFRWWNEKHWAKRLADKFQSKKVSSSEASSLC
ncbi:hypothetical protein BDQ17DRAFT_1004707 [Cyathus striatus]|nr:hypothetical protein BDQ17DRAFT_1004707 [Cyathus striatus]